MREPKHRPDFRSILDVVTQSSDFAPRRPNDPGTIGPFAIEEQYGVDTSASIYLARDDSGQVLVRILDRRLIPNREAADLATLRVRSLEDLQGFGIAAIRDYSWDSNPPWIAVETGAELSLASLIAAHGVMGSRDTQILSLFLARTLDAMHVRGLIHGSLRPSSLRILPGQPILTDAGLYAPVRDLLGTGASSTVVDAAWITPEQLLGGSVTEATDVYLWALLVLFAATGANPFSAGEARTALARIRTEIPMVGHVLQEPLASLVTAALAKDPLSRPPMADIVRQLGGDRVLSGPSIEPTSDDLITEPGDEESLGGIEEIQEPPEEGEVTEEEIANEPDLPPEEAQSRRFPRWLVVAVIIAIMLGVGVGLLIGRLIVGSAVPLMISQPASLVLAEVAWGG